MSICITSLIKDGYEIKAIGQGDEAVVYKASKLGKVFAIRLSPFGQDLNINIKASELAKIKCPHFPLVYDSHTCTNLILEKENLNVLFCCTNM